MARSPLKKNRQGEGGGQPPKYSSAQELITAISSFFAICEDGGHLPEKAGLCIHLGISRETYSQYKDKYPDAIKYANGYIEQAWVRRLGAASAAGAIFYLKNAFAQDYKDKTETDVTTKGEKIGSTDNVLELAARAAELLKAEKL